MVKCIYGFSSAMQTPFLPVYLIYYSLISEAHHQQSHFSNLHSLCYRPVNAFNNLFCWAVANQISARESWHLHGDTQTWLIFPICPVKPKDTIHLIACRVKWSICVSLGLNSTFSTKCKHNYALVCFSAKHHIDVKWNIGSWSPSGDNVGSLKDFCSLFWRKIKGFLNSCWKFF